MKPKHILIVAFLLLSLKGFSQYFNHEIFNYYYNSAISETITTNRLNQIVFLSVNQGSPNFPNDMELVKLDRSGNYLLSKRVFDTLGTLKPGSIILTKDTCYIVTGTYYGPPPSGYPSVPGGVVSTTFYAKFDNNFNLLWFKLQWGYPYILPYVTTQNISPSGIVAVPNGPNENYIAVNYATGYDTITLAGFQTILLDKFDASGNLIREVHANIPGYFDINVLPVISYLPANNMCAVTGGFFNTSLLGLPQTPFIFTFDLGLTTASNFTYYTSVYNNDVPSNVVEEQMASHNLLFCFSSGDPTSYPLTCSSASKQTSLVFMKVKPSNTGSILVSKDYTSSCMQSVRNPLTIKNVLTDSTAVMIGFTQGEPAPFTSPSHKPAMLKINTNGNVVSYHLYNPTEPDNLLQYMNNFVGDSFILHINKYFDTSSQSTRIIKTDNNGRSFCTDTPGIDTSSFAIAGVDSPLVLIKDSALLIHDYPVLHIDSFGVYACDTAFARPAISHINTVAQIPIINVYPNPTNENLNIVINGDPGIIQEFIVTNTIGQVLIRREVIAPAGNNNFELDVSKLRPGIYLLQMANNGKAIVTRSFVKL